MATPSKDRVLMPSDLLYFLTFAAGMAAFWVGGHASVLATHGVRDHTMSVILGLVVSGGTYGLGMLLLSLAMLRRFGRGVMIATVLAIILGFGAAQVIVRLAASHVHNAIGVGLLTFALYLCYGIIYVASLAIGRRFAK